MEKINFETRQSLENGTSIVISVRVSPRFRERIITLCEELGYSHISQFAFNALREKVEDYERNLSKHLIS